MNYQSVSSATNSQEINCLIKEMLNFFKLGNQVKFNPITEPNLQFHFYKITLAETNKVQSKIEKVVIDLPETLLQENSFTNKVRLCEILAKIKLIFQNPDLDVLYQVQGNEWDIIRFYFFILPLQGMWSFHWILNYFKTKGEEEKFITYLLTYYQNLLNFCKKEKINFQKQNKSQEVPILYAYWMCIFYSLIYEKFFILKQGLEKERYLYQFPNLSLLHSEFKEKNNQVISLYYTMLSREISLQTIKDLVETLQKDYQLIVTKNENNIPISIVLKSK